MNSDPIKVLLLENDADYATRILDAAARTEVAALDVVVADRLADGVTCMEKESFDVVLFNPALPDGRGLDTLVELRNRGLAAPILVLSSVPDASPAVAALRKGAEDYLIKVHMNADTLLRIIRHAHERNRARASLLASESRFRKMIQHNADAILVVDCQGVIQFVNPAAEILFERSADELIGSSFGFPLTRAETEEIDILHKHGTSSIAEMRVVEIEWGQTPMYLASMRDLTDRINAEKALRLSEQRFREMADLLPTVICEVDLQMRVSYVNDAGLKLFGYAQQDLATEIDLSDIVHPEDRATLIARWDQMIMGESLENVEFRVLTKAGEELTVLVNAAPMVKDDQIWGARISLTDTTEHKRLQHHLQDAERMKTVGVLAGGIAHKFNNSLSAVVGNIDLLCLKFPEHAGINEHARAVHKSAQHMTELTAQLLAYARGGKYSPEMILPVKVINSALSLVKHTMDSAIRIETAFDEDVPVVEADLAQIQMVISSVLINAAEACSDDCRIKISLRRVDIGPDDVADRPTNIPGAYVCIEIADNGRGMEAQTRAKIFEPFFTTKFQGRGLGMAAAYGVVNNHAGWIDVKSRLNQGTVVRIYLPVTQSKRSKEPDVQRVG